MINTHPVYYPMYHDKEKFVILVTGGRGCETPTQEVVMYDMTVKQLKDIKIGDKLMGVDGTPRTVLDLHSGRSMMYRVHQPNAEDYYVNENHILCLKKSASAHGRSKGWRNGHQRKQELFPDYGEYIEMPVSEFLQKSAQFKRYFYGYKLPTLPYKEQEVKIEPYMLGVWLGDGTSIYPQITTQDKEVVEYLQSYADRNGLLLTLNGERGKARIYRLAKNSGHDNKFMDLLRYYNLVGNKHIPHEYIANSEQVRLELLAGLLDTDGHMERNGYEIIQKKEDLARQIKFIADSLGFKTSISEKKAYIRNGEERKYCGIYYRVFINGDVWRIPCKVEHKKVYEETCHKNKDWRASLLSIEECGIGDWIGIVLDGDRKYLHPDFTTMHNSGKSYSSGTFIERLTFELNKIAESDNVFKKVVHNILYTRYTMTSASISVIPEFLEKVDADGVGRYFTKTKNDVINIKTGSHIMFRGIKTSSGNQTAKLKSIHGITTFVVDEAEEWRNESEFDTIALSLRQKGIQNRVIIIMNPTDSNHFIYQKYIKNTHKVVMYDGVPVQISTHPNVLHIHTTYLDNKEHLSEQFLKEVEQMKIDNPKKYAHTVMGRWADVAEGAIFTNWSIIEEFPTDCKKVSLALDLGYSTDPSACAKYGIKNNDLYVDEQFYETGLLTHQLIARLKECSYDEEQGIKIPIYSESADPRMIDEFKLGGLLVYPVDKSGLSIKAGIEKIKDFDHIYVTKRSYNWQEEARNYTWAKDKDGNFVNQPIDAYNHHMDNMRYYVLGKILGKILKPRPIKGDLPIY